MSRPLAVFVVIVFFAGLSSLTGCGSGKYVPVSGELVYPDGAPVTGLDGGQVIFREVEGPNGPGPNSAAGAIDAQGKFVMSTEQLGDGAAPTNYVVSIVPPAPTGDVPLPRAIHPKYEKFETSGLTQEVKPRMAKLKLTLEPPK
jgi:hypothetical protein